MPRTPDEPLEVVWEAPPPKQIKSKFDSALKEVKERRGQWGRIRVYPTSSSAYSGRKTVLRAAGDDPHWEAAVAPLQDSDSGEHGLYVRYRTPEQLREVK